MRSTARFIATFLALATFIVGACSDKVPSVDEDPIDIASGLQVKEDDPSTLRISFDLVFPAGTNVQSTTVGARSHLEVGAGAKVLGESPLGGLLSSAGSDDEDEDEDEADELKTRIGPNAIVGDVLSVPRIDLGAHASAFRATSASIVTLRQGASANRITEHAKLTPLVRRFVTAHVSPGAHDLRVPATATATPLPGRYHHLLAEKGATIVFSSGTYLVDRLLLREGVAVKLVTDG